MIDTNVAVVANGRYELGAGKYPSIDCQIAAIEFLQSVLENGKILVDLDGYIQTEYRRYLAPSGQPGVGDRFYQEVLMSAPNRIERIEVPVGADGEYLDLPRAIVDAGFDRSDRKFAAVAKREAAPVANAVDSDWLHHRVILEENGIEILFLCGCDQLRWYA